MTRVPNVVVVLIPVALTLPTTKPPITQYTPTSPQCPEVSWMMWQASPLTISGQNSMLRFINFHKKETLSKNKPTCGIVSAIQGYTSIQPKKLKPQLEANSISRMARCAANGMVGWWLSVATMGDTFWTTCFETTKQIQIQTVNIFVLKLPIGLSDMSILSPFITQSDLKIVER
jgi:hypothetical protein